MSGTKQYEWLHFLNHAQEEIDQPAQNKYTDPAIRQAFTVLDRISADEDARRLADIREKG